MASIDPTLAQLLAEWWAGRDWDKTFTIVVALAAVAQAIVAVVMVKGLKHSAMAASAATETLREGKISSERQLRAYVDLSEATVSVRAQGQPVSIEIKLRNYGQTPAKRFRATVQASIIPPGELDALEATGQPLSDATLGPGIDTSVHLGFAAAEVGPVYAQWDSGQRILAVAGRVTYVDIFDKERVTTFRLFQEGDRPLLSHAGTGNAST